MAVKPIEGKRAGRKRIKEEVRERVIRLYNADELTIDEIVRVCGVSKSSVFRILREGRAEDAGTKV